MNKKALAGKALTFVVFIIIILIMAIFLSLVSFTALFKKQGALTAEQTRNQDFLLKTVYIEGKQEDFLVLDAIILFEKDEIEKEELIDALKTLLNDELNCIAVAKDNSPNPAGKTGGEAADDIFIRKENEGYYTGHKGSIPSILASYKRDNSLGEISINLGENKLYIEYYYGKC